MRGQLRDRGGGVWDIVIFRGRNAAGRPVYKSTRFRGTRREAERRLAELVAKAGDTSATVAADLTVKEYLTQWLAGAAALRVSARTLQGYQSIVEHHLVPLLGRHKLNRLTSLHIEAAWVHLSREGRRDGRGRGLAPRTVLHAHRCLHAALEQAVKKGLLARNPAHGAETPRQQRTEVIALDEAQLRRLLLAVKGTRLYVPVLISATTGMRRGEVCALRWRDVDFERATIAVRRAAEVTKAHGVRFKEPKSGAGRQIAMPEVLVAALRRHKAEQAAHRLQVGPDIWHDEDLVVANAAGGPWSPNALSRAFIDFVRKLDDVPRVSFHSLRHTAATLLLGRGVGVKLVQDLLGHSTPVLTLGTYGHSLKAHQQEAARQIDLALSDSPAEYTGFHTGQPSGTDGADRGK